MKVSSHTQTTRLTSNSLARQLAIALLATSALTVVHANPESTSPAVNEVGLSVSPFGLGIFYAHELSDQWSIKGQISGADEDDVDFELSDLDYEGDAEVGSLSLGVEWRPFTGKWSRKVYFSSGIVAFEGDFKGDAKSKIGGSINVGGANILASSINGLKVDVDYEDQLSPYLGVGWRSKAAGQTGWAFNTEFSIFYADDPKVTLTADDPGAVLSQSNIDQERKDIIDDLGGLSASGTLGVSYRF